jgi:hypothetical protein
MRFRPLLGNVTERLGRAHVVDSLVEKLNAARSPDVELEIFEQLLQEVPTGELHTDDIRRRGWEHIRRASTDARWLQNECDAANTQLEEVQEKLRDYDAISKRQKRDVVRLFVTARRRFERFRKRAAAANRAPRIHFGFGTTRPGNLRRHNPIRNARWAPRPAPRRTQTDSGGSDDGDGPGEPPSPLVRRCSLRLDKPEGPPETSDTLAAGYSTELTSTLKLKACVRVGSREVGVKSRSDEGTLVPLSRRRPKWRPKAASSFLDNFGITRPIPRCCRRRRQ